MKICLPQCRKLYYTVTVPQVILTTLSQCRKLYYTVAVPLTLYARVHYYIIYRNTMLQFIGTTFWLLILFN